MRTVKCSACGVTTAVSTAGTGHKAVCPNCGGMLRVPRASATARALEQAMKEMDAKEQQRKGGSKSPARSGGAAPIELNARRSTSAAPPVATPPTGEQKFQITSRQWKILSGVLGGAALIAVLWFTFAPSAWESDNRGQVLQIKAEADGLAAQGKAVEAYWRYQRVLTMVAGQNLKSSDLNKAVADSRAARERIVEEHRSLIDKARTAAASQ